MSAGLDTSVVVRLLVGDPADQADAARRLFDECLHAGSPASVSALVVAEAFFVLQHHYGVPPGVALKQLAALLSDPRVSRDAEILKVLRTPGLATAKPGCVGRLIHAGYRSRGCTPTTFDRSVAKLPGTRLREA